MSTRNANLPNLDGLEQKLCHYEKWRMDLMHAVNAYLQWVEGDSVIDDERSEFEQVSVSLYETLEALKNDKLIVALVGEYSRGKTELINAVFFADYERRLLPSTPGRTTMCPTELLHEVREDPSIRLLPIATRSERKSVSQFKRDPAAWTKMPLNIESVDEMSIAMGELVKSQQVTLAEANALGFNVNDESPDVKDGKVEIPTWRHAVINYPHPLLTRGLVILDTPGLNALGSEPELTLRMLPSAHAVLFVLAADTGVTHSDMQIWKNHVCVATQTTERSRLAALNKIDTLWDELLTPQQVQLNIGKQVKETARLLDMSPSNVFPVSAVKGLLAKVRDDRDLLAETGILALEAKISDEIVASKQELLREKVSGDIGTMVEASRQTLIARLENRESQVGELEALHGKSQDVLKISIERLHKQKTMFESEVDSFRVTRRQLSDEITALLTMLSLKRFDLLFADTRKSMKGSLTTAGLKGSMTTLFKEINGTLNRVEIQSEQVCRMVEKSYEKFHKDHGLPSVSPAKFSAKRHTKELSKLLAEAEAFRNSSEMLVTEQGSLIEKFFDTMISRMRSIIKETNHAAKNWATAVLNPIRDQIREHKGVINTRLENLEALRNSQLDLKSRVTGLENEIQSVRKELHTIENVLRLIKRTTATPAHSAPVAATAQKIAG